MLTAVMTGQGGHVLDDSGFQSKSQLERLLEAAGASPRKRYGQCFLIDRNLMRKLVESAEISPDDWVLEVGCGAGSLTSLLSSVAKHVIVSEIDAAMVGLATDHLGDRRNVDLIHGDALHNKSTMAPAVVKAMRVSRESTTGLGMLVANLPYDVATSLVVNLLIGDFGIERFCFTVQAEVADRFLAGVGTSDYGPVSIISQSLAIGRRIARVPPEAFWPRPRVQSAMVRLDRLPREALRINDAAGFSQFLRTVFQTRRKTLRHILSRLPGGDAKLARLAELGPADTVRPQDVPVDVWQALYLVAD
jgi:16S rRNA (adenine1518-N6/adenine1519-N6)-dimethyltransferase